MDTVNKRVDVAYWANIRRRTRKKRWSEDEDEERITYTGKLEFALDENKFLCAKAHYTYTAQQAIGGVWINGRSRGYLAHEEYIPYTICGYDMYHFCTRTNKYIGYKKFKEDKARGWQEAKGRY